MVQHLKHGLLEKIHFQDFSQAKIGSEILKLFVVGFSVPQILGLMFTCYVLYQSMVQITIVHKFYRSGLLFILSSYQCSFLFIFFLLHLLVTSGFYSYWKSLICFIFMNYSSSQLQYFVLILLKVTMDPRARIGMSAQMLLHMGGWWFDSTWIRLLMSH